MEALIREGEVLDGKFRVDRVLGQGGMGVVVAATHIQLRQRVALKFLLSASPNAEATSRFIREARAAAGIRSEHVARVTDVATLPSGTPYLVMEYLDGTDLGALVASTGSLSVHEAVGYLLQACQGVAAAHAVGIVHRDLKPANLFLTRGPDGSPLVKVLDFGISKRTAPGADGTAGTAIDALLGSPEYMSPEQIRSTKDVDARTDVWALGVIAYELLTGRTPFRAETLSAILASVIADTPVGLRTLRADVPRGLEAAVLAALEKDRSKRTPDVARYAAAIAAFGGSEANHAAARVAAILGQSSGAAQLDRTVRMPHLASTPPAPVEGTPAPPPSPSTAPATTTNSSVEDVVPARKRDRGRATAVAIVGALAVVVGGLVLLGRPGKGTLVVTAHGAGGAGFERIEVLVDGRRACAASPCEVAGLAPGTHAVTVRAPGFSTVTEELRVEASERVIKSMVLVPLVGGGVSVKSEGGAWSLWVDGAEVGELPQVVKGLSVGEHVFRVPAGDRNSEWQQRVTVEEGKHQSLEVKPKITKGLATIRAGAGAEGAKVLLVRGSERRPVPSLPLRVDIPTDSSWSVVASRAGFEDFAADLTFPDGQPERTFVVTLVPKPSRLADAAPADVAPREASEGSVPSVASSRGTLNINSIPPSNIILDGKPLGQTPKVGVSVSPGAHTVIFVHPEHGRKAKAVTVEGGQSVAAVVRFP